MIIRRKWDERNTTVFWRDLMQTIDRLWLFVKRAEDKRVLHLREVHQALYCDNKQQWNGLEAIVYASCVNVRESESSDENTLSWKACLASILNCDTSWVRSMPVFRTLGTFSAICRRWHFILSITWWFYLLRQDAVCNLSCKLRISELSLGGDTEIKDMTRDAN